MHVKKRVRGVLPCDRLPTLEEQERHRVISSTLPSHHAQLSLNFLQGIRFAFGGCPTAVICPRDMERLDPLIRVQGKKAETIRFPVEICAEGDR